MLTEPLGALRVPLGGLAQRLECPMDDPRLLRAVEPALEVWSDLVPLPRLRAALPSALRLARLARCESWLRCFAAMTDEELGEYGDAASYWLAAARRLDDPDGLRPDMRQGRAWNSCSSTVLWCATGTLVVEADR